MKKIFKKLINATGLNLSLAADNNSIKSLINKLKPYNVGYDLIRLGPDADSGYLLPNDLEGIEACFSPGCDNKYQFEENCFDRNMKVFIADKTVENKDVPAKFNFTKKFISSISNEDFMTIDQWVSNSVSNENSDLLLQMDIEGDEYQCILNMTDELLNRFRIIVIEFHDLDKLFNSFFYRIVSVVFEKLLQNHTCVHIHPNNNLEIITIDGISIPPLSEFTFIRNDRVKSKKSINTFPHPLDQDCVSGKTTQTLPNMWFE
tara:strand:- start:576 stop:1358 length:783 start_codon:yes stop_codon:yes gene_type:complete